jgi:hypothetical protein
MTPGEFEAYVLGKREDDKRQRIERLGGVMAILTGLGEKTSGQKLWDLVVGKDKETSDEEEELISISRERAHQARMKMRELN